MRIASLAALVALASPPAIAHALLRDATPAVGSTIATSPPEVAIDFSEAIEPAFSRIVVQDMAGHPVQSGDAHLDAGQTARLAVGLPRLPPGTYKVIWHVTSTDTHKTQGSFSFSVAP